MTSPPRAAVLIAVRYRWRPRLLLLQRAGHLALHPGEVALPGGKTEPGEHSPWQTALREAREELALPPGQVRPLAQLSTRSSKTGIAVTPVVGLVEELPALSADPGEVDHYFWVPLERFLPPQRPRQRLVVEPGRLRSTLSYWHCNYHIWGLTARILAELGDQVVATGGWQSWLALAKAGKIEREFHPLQRASQEDRDDV